MLLGAANPRPSLPPPCGQQQRVDAHQLAGGVHQRTAAAARVDRRVGLDVDHRVVGLELPSHRAHHAHRHRVVEAERAAEREHQLPGAQPVGIAERERRQRRAAHLEQRQVGLLVHAGDLGVERPAARADDRLALDTPRQAPPGPGGRPAPRGSWSPRTRRRPRSRPSPTPGVCSTSPSGVVASGSTTRPEAITCTTLGLTRVASASNDALSSLSDGRAGAVRAAWACAGCGAAVPTAAASTMARRAARRRVSGWRVTGAGPGRRRWWWRPAAA